jgi:hypothetical protein
VGLDRSLTARVVTLFRFFLVDEGGEPLDPVTFITAVPNWSAGETFSLASGESLRIVEIRTGLAPEVVDAGFNGVLIVESV